MTFLIAVDSNDLKSKFNKFIRNDELLDLAFEKLRMKMKGEHDFSKQYNIAEALEKIISENFLKNT